MTYREQVLLELNEMAKLDMVSAATVSRIAAFLDTDAGRAEIAELESGFCRISDAADLLQYSVKGTK